MSDSFLAMSSQAKKHTWKGEVVQTKELSPCPESLDSGFGSFPASPYSSTNSSNDGPPTLATKCCDFFNNQLQNDAPPTLVCALFDDCEEDAPMCKMPRLFAMDEESDCEISQPASPISLPLSVPEKELDEPKPETASIPESTTTLKSKRVRISTPDEADSENIDPYAKFSKPQHPCRWGNCRAEFFDVNDLYDHAMEKHLHPIRPSTSSAKTTSTRRMAVRDDKEELSSEHKYCCQWADCEQTLKRGTEEKKYNFLATHFLRHAPKAQPLKCLIERCPVRFKTTKALNAHLFNSHDEKTKPVRKVQQVVTKSCSCFDYELPVRTENYIAYDFFDKHSFGLIADKVQHFYATHSSTNTEATEKPLSSGVQCMSTKKTVNVLRKLFAEKMIHTKC
ncbi:Zinc finger protein jing [Aphelenchoides bicaudatus]|nr:Zinc finger protein jing [Aphelenchoides bicaudatus]